jgi:hypothetical protein
MQCMNQLMADTIKLKVEMVKEKVKDRKIKKARRKFPRAFHVNTEFKLMQPLFFCDV